jgi:hypothetical protein
LGVDYKASEDLAKRAVWTEDSLGYAREHGQRTLVRLLSAVKADVEFEGALRDVARAPDLRDIYRGRLRATMTVKPRRRTT